MDLIFDVIKSHIWEFVTIILSISSLVVSYYVLKFLIIDDKQRIRLLEEEADRLSLANEHYFDWIQEQTKSSAKKSIKQISDHITSNRSKLDEFERALVYLIDTTRELKEQTKEMVELNDEIKKRDEIIARKNKKIEELKRELKLYE